MSPRATGKVKFFNDEKGFGFITPDGGGEEAFFHHTALPKGISVIGQGDKVSYEVTKSEKGNGVRAVNLQLG